MRVLTVGNMYPPHALGGYEVTWEASVEHLRAGGHEVEVLTTGFRVPRAAGHRDPVWVHRDLGWYWRDHAFPRMSLRERLGLERRNARVLDDRLRRSRPDIVCWWAMGGMSLSLIERVRATGLPAVGVVGDEWMTYGPAVDGWTRPFRGRGRPAARLAERITGVPTRVDLGRAAHWLFVSEGVRDAARKDWDLPSTEIAHPGVELERFTGAEPAGEWRWRLAVIGRLDPRKGIDVAVRALAELPAQATLAVTGGGDDKHEAELRALAGKLGLEARVTFDSLPHDQVPSAYAAADVVLFPVTWNEPWGLVPLEAMAAARPVVSSGRGGQAAYLRDGQNCLVASPDPAAFADAVRRLAGDAGLRERLVGEGEATAARHPSRAYDHAIEDALLKATTSRLTSRPVAAK